MKNIAIIGTRDYPAEMIETALLQIEGEEIMLLTGGHTASEAGKKIAKMKGWEIGEYLPNYKKYGQGATHMRSKEMLQQAHEVLTFWNGISKGTANEMQIAQKMGKKMTHYGQKPQSEQAGLF